MMSVKRSIYECLGISKDCSKKDIHRLQVQMARKRETTNRAIPTDPEDQRKTVLLDILCSSTATLAYEKKGFDSAVAVLHEEMRLTAQEEQLAQQKRLETMDNHSSSDQMKLRALKIVAEMGIGKWICSDSLSTSSTAQGFLHEQPQATQIPQIRAETPWNAHELSQRLQKEVEDAHRNAEALKLTINTKEEEKRKLKSRVKELDLESEALKVQVEMSLQKRDNFKIEIIQLTTETKELGQVIGTVREKLKKKQNIRTSLIATLNYTQTRCEDLKMNVSKLEDQLQEDASRMSNLETYLLQEKEKIKLAEHQAHRLNNETHIGLSNVHTEPTLILVDHTSSMDSKKDDQELDTTITPTNQPRLMSKRKQVPKRKLLERFVAEGNGCYSCMECGSQITNYSALSRHSKKHKPRSLNLTCDICQEAFYRRDTFTKHMAHHSRGDSDIMLS